MRLLFLSLMLPEPPNNGHKMRVGGLLRALAAEGHQITLLSFASKDERDANLAPLQRICREIEIVPHSLHSLSASSSHLGRVRSLLSSRPHAAARFSSAIMRERISRHLAGGGFDAVVSDSIFSLVNLPSIPLPLVLNNVDIEHVILKRYLPFARNPIKRLYAWLESRKLKAWELRACQRATIRMACSEHDSRLIDEFCPGLPAVVVPNVVDTDAYTPVISANELLVLYQGAMDWYPNRDAVEFFVTTIMPELRMLVPGVKLLIAGRNPPVDFRRRFAESLDVELTGSVPDMRPIMARAAVCVVPLRIGSGTRLKILEAAAMGKPIVSTSLGAEGLEFLDGEEILLADDPGLFARATAALLNDGPRRQAIGAAARRRVVLQYGLPALQQALRVALAPLFTSRALPNPGSSLGFPRDVGAP